MSLAISLQHRLDALRRKCSTGYGCGSTCISLRKECRTSPSSAIGKQRMKRLLELAAGGKVPQRGIAPVRREEAGQLAGGISARRGQQAAQLKGARQQAAAEKAKAAPPVRYTAKAGGDVTSQPQRSPAMANPKPFTTPDHLAAALRDQVETRLLKAAQAEAERITALVSAGSFRNSTRVNRELVDVDYDAVTRQVLAVKPKTASLRRMAREQADHNVALLEQRVSQHLGAGEQVTRNTLKVSGNELIEGHVMLTAANGDDARVYVRMVWNYRYGENSANRVLTQYAQFRSERSGAPLPGKSVTQTKTEAEKAAKAAEKAARAAAQVEKLQKAPARIARAMRKNIAYWGANHPTAPEWLAVAKLAEAMTPKQVEELFAAGSRTSGDIEGQLERQVRQARQAA